MVTESKSKAAARRLSTAEQETIINFNKEDKTASVFTYEKTWQKHLEQKLGLKPVKDNGFGGREYQIARDRIPMPRARMVLTPEEKARRGDNLARVRKQQKTLL